MESIDKTVDGQQSPDRDIFECLEGIYFIDEGRMLGGTKCYSKQLARCGCSRSHILDF